MKRVRLAIVVFGVVFTAWLAPQALAGGDVFVQVLPQGSGSGSTVAFNGSINCGYSSPTTTGPICSETVFGGDFIVLTAFPLGSSTFGGWASNSCPEIGPGANQCTIDTTDLSGANVTPRPVFNSTTRTLTVTRTGSGAGTVTGPGISCGADCTQAYTTGTVVTLVASPAAGSRFSGWGGGCAGSGTNLVCILSMAVNQAVSASFTAQPAGPLSVTVSGGGSGSVSSSPAGIACPSDCTQTYNVGQVVNLTATAAAGSVFTGWTGAGCSGTAGCVVTIGTSATVVTASFQLAQVQASLVGWHTSKAANGTRRTRATISAQQVVNFTIRVVRGQNVIASRQILNFQPGQRQVVLRIPNRTAGGRATLQVTFINSFQATKSQSGNVKVPSR